MRVYIEFIKNAFQANLAYRMNVVLGLIIQLIVFFVQIYLWRALYEGIGRATTKMGVISLRDMITYTIISNGISIIIGTNVLMRLDEKIKTGEIAMDLIKPMNLKACLFCETLGDSYFRVFSMLIPLLTAGILIFGIGYPSSQNFVFFLIALGNGMFIYFVIAYILGLTGFWYLKVWHYRMMIKVSMDVFGGAIIPLWFFPDILIQLSNFLPFRLIYFAPLTIYLEKVLVVDAVWFILQQFLWIGILLLIEKLIWLKGMRKVVIQGG